MVKSTGNVLSYLMVKAQNGDQNAYRQLLQEILPQLRSYVGRRLSDKDKVEDTVQNILMAIHKNRHTYLEGKPFMPWAYGIAYYKLSDTLRSGYRHKNNEVAQSDWIETFSADQTNKDNSDAKHDLDIAFEVLSDKQAHIVKRTKLDGATINEVASETGMSESAVKVTIHRALKKMKERLVG